MQASDSLLRSKAYGVGWVPLWATWSGSLGLSVSLMANTSLFGRLPLPTVIRGWAGSVVLTGLLLACFAWWMTYAALLRRHRSRSHLAAAVIPAIPLVLGTTLPLVLLYLSDLLNHYFYYSMVYLNQPKTLALLLLLMLSSFLLQLIHIRLAAGRTLNESLGDVLAKTREPVIQALLAVLGTFQVSAYLDRFYDDFILRYWPVADALITRAPYPATMVAGVWQAYFVEGGLAKYLIELPVYPAVVAASFSIFGHNVVAGYVPTVVANIVLPPALYLLYREVIRSRMVALLLVGVTVLFPPMRLYVLNWTGPDPVFYVLFTISCWLYVRASKGDRRNSTWAGLGLATAAMALTRPEGIAYAGVYVLAALSMRVPPGRKIVLGGLCAAPIGAFSLFMMVMFQMPWPRNWTGSIGFQNITANWRTLADGQLDRAAQQMRLSPNDLLIYGAMLLIIAFAGAMYLLLRQWRLAVLFLPAWINVLSVLVIDPRVSGSYLWYDFFRHISFPLPLMVLAMGVAAEASIQAFPRPTLRLVGISALCFLLLWVVNWNIHVMSKPAFSYGADASNILGTGRLNFIDLVSSHPFALPVFAFEQADGYWVVTAWHDTIWGYPDYLSEFFGAFNAVGRATGVAYETASLFIYLAALAFAVVPALGQSGLRRNILYSSLDVSLDTSGSRLAWANSDLKRREG